MSGAALATGTSTVPDLEEWRELLQEGVAIIQFLSPVKDAVVRLRRKKVVDERQLASTLVDTHYNSHLGFRGIINRMAGMRATREQQRTAARALVTEYLKSA